MSNASAGESEPIKPPRPLTALQQLEAQLKETRAKVTAERSRIKKERSADKQKSHVQMILGSIITHGGNERIAKALASADWLDPDKKLAVEYYYGLRENPKNGKNLRVVRLTVSPVAGKPDLLIGKITVRNQGKLRGGCNAYRGPRWYMANWSSIRL